MDTKLTVTYIELSEQLKIPIDRFQYITSYVSQMINDYQGNVADIIKEVILNLKGNERYIVMYMMGRSSSQIFSKSSEGRQEEFINSILGALKINEEIIDQITIYILENLVREEEKHDIQTISIMRQIINSNFTDTEKDYILFTFGLTDF